MSWNPKGKRYPPHWGPVIAMLLVIGAMTLLILGSWVLSFGLNGTVIDSNNPYFHFTTERTVRQEITDGAIELSLGALCLIVLITLFFTRRKFLFPSQKSEKTI